MYTYVWVALLYSSNQHSIVIQLYFKKTNKQKELGLWNQLRLGSDSVSTTKQPHDFRWKKLSPQKLFLGICYVVPIIFVINCDLLLIK